MKCVMRRLGWCIKFVNLLMGMFSSIGMCMLGLLFRPGFGIVFNAPVRYLNFGGGVCFVLFFLQGIPCDGSVPGFGSDDLS